MFSRKEHKSKSAASNLHSSSLAGSRSSAGASSARADESGASSDADADGDESDEDEDTDVHPDLAAKSQPLIGASQAHFAAGDSFLDFKPPIHSSGAGGHLYAQQLHSPTSPSMEAIHSHSLPTRTSLHLQNASNGALLSPLALTGALSASAIANYCLCHAFANQNSLWFFALLILAGNCTRTHVEFETFC